MRTEDEEDATSAEALDPWAPSPGKVAGAAQEGAGGSGGVRGRRRGFTPQGFANSVWALGALRADAVARGVPPGMRSASVSCVNGYRPSDLDNASFQQASVSTVVQDVAKGTSEALGSDGTLPTSLNPVRSMHNLLVHITAT